MPRQLSRIAWSVSRTIIFVAALGACAMPSAYMAERLDSVPQPTPVLMAQAPVPDCESQPVRTVPAVSPRSPGKEIATATAATDFEDELRNTEPLVVTERQAEPVSDIHDSELARLEAERDCYRRAEQLARQRLEALQASSAETLAALDDIRNNPPDQGQLPAW